MRRFLAALLLAAACSKKSEPTPAPPVEPPAAPAAPAEAEVRDPNAPFPGSDRLEPLLSRMQAEGAPYGVDLAIGHLKGRFEARAKEWSELSLPDARSAGVAEPEIRDFDEQDKARRGARFKWYAADGASYGDRLPEAGDGVTEAWARVYGFRDLSTGDTLMVVNNVAADKWRRMQWQPTRRRWSYFTEADDLAGRQALIAGRLSKPDGDRRLSAKFELERLAKPMREAESKGQNAEGYRNNMRRAILEAWDRELTLEAARWAAER
ncbi:MAG: hypothetical protein HY925_09125 [Elusimicrobia bacterium]|nr:hypothetical protein [Elusimicrobiota bacterium]